MVTSGDRGPRPFRRNSRSIPRVPGGRGIIFSPIEEIRNREKLFLSISDTAPTQGQLRFDQGVRLAWELWVARQGKLYRGDLNGAVMLLFTKAMNDFLATSHLFRSGYQLSAFATLRGGVEATEVMEYLLVHPDDATAWLNMDSKFSTLGRIKDNLPKLQDRTDFYDFVNNIIHCNAQEIIGFCSMTKPDGSSALQIGPVKSDPGLDLFELLLARIISYPVRILWSHDSGVVSQDWIERFYHFDSALGFPFGDAWTP